MQGQFTHHVVVALIGGIRIGSMDLVEQARRMRIARGQAQRQTRATHGRRDVLGLGLKEILAQVGVGAGGALAIACTRQHRERERCPFLLVLERAEQLGQIQAVVAVHGVPAHGLHQGVASTHIILLANVGIRHVGIQAIKGHLDLHQLARILFHAAVGQTLKLAIEAKVLALLLRLALGVDILLGELNQTLQQRRRHGQVALRQIVLGIRDVLQADGQIHGYSSI